MLNTDKKCEAFFVSKAIDKNLIFVKLFLSDIFCQVFVFVRLNIFVSVFGRDTKFLYLFFIFSLYLFFISFLQEKI